MNMNIILFILVMIWLRMNLTEFMFLKRDPENNTQIFELKMRLKMRLTIDIV